MASYDVLDQLYLLQNKHQRLEEELHEQKEEVRKLKAVVIDGIYQAAPREKTVPSFAQKAPPVAPVPAQAKFPQKIATPQKPKAAPALPKSPKPVTPKKDLRTREMDFGKVWFVRLGIISLITGLVFLSNFAYQNYIYNWGPAPRLTGLYFLSALMLGIGTYFEKAKKALANYGHVLAAGGIATLYYTSYAAHYIERLRVIDSTLLGGIVLLTTAAACLAYALWKKSTTTALCSIVLAFYSTSINPVGAFTLISGLILTLTGVTLLDRLRQASIGFTTMLGAYLSFIYWQLLVNHGSHYAHASWFVLGYWILCTAVILKQRLQSKPFFSETQLLTYTSINNSLFIFLTSINFATQQFYTSVWLNIASIGVVFILISLFLYKKKQHPLSLAHLYLGKGFALITLALCIKLSGTSLAISLTIQAMLALIAGTYSERKLLLTAGGLALLLGFGIYATQITQATGILHGIMLTLYLGLATFLHLLSQKKLPIFMPLASLASVASFFAMVALCSLIVTADISVFAQIIISLSLFSALRSLKAFSFYRYIPTPFYELTHLLAMVGIFLTAKSLLFELNQSKAAVITTLLFIAAAVQTVGKLKWDSVKQSVHFNGFYNTIATLMLLITLGYNRNLDSTMLIVSLLPIAYHYLFGKVRLASIPIIGLLCYIVPWSMSLVGYSSSYMNLHPVAQLGCALIPLAHVYLMKYGQLCHLGKQSDHHLQKVISALLITASAGMISLWQYHTLPVWELTLALTATLFYWIDDRKSLHSFSLCALVMYLVSFASILVMPQESYTLRYFVILIPFITYFANLSKAMTPRVNAAEINQSIAIGFSLALWFIASQHTIALAGSSALSICWALIGLAILSFGFIAKDIVFRTMSFIILGATILHVYGVDVWKITALFRILSFITLGLVLLIIGYLYSRKVDNHGEENDDT